MLKKALLLPQKAFKALRRSKLAAAVWKKKMANRFYRWRRFFKKYRWPLTIISIISLGALIYILRDLPSPQNLTARENFAVSTQIFDRNGKLLYEIYDDENRIPIKIGELPDYVKQATIAIEDRNFYRHFGFDLVGIARALINNLQSKNIQGGSTITQQLVKNALLSPEKSIKRKLKEAVLALATEIIYSKDEILEMYLNYISYGGTAVGIEAAANKYFDKSAKDLSLAEATLLVGLPQAPSKYSPFFNPERAKQRQKEVLRRMVEDKYITAEQARQAENEQLKFALSKTDIRAPHFVFYVRDLLYQKYGVKTVERGGLRVTTSLDIELQEAAQASLSGQIKKLTRHNVSNGAAMVTKPATGEILAMVGSRDYFDQDIDGKVNVALALRQPGSSIKPIMYATAFQLKALNPGSLLLDIPTCFHSPGQRPYCPKNYDGDFRGPVTVRQALGNSLNIPAVKALRIIGVEALLQQGKKMGITTWKDASQYGLSLTLGGGEVKMIDMAQAFGALANLGIKVPLTPILKITDYTGKTLWELDIEQRQKDFQELQNFAVQQKGDLKRALDAAPAYLVDHIMQDNQARSAAFGVHSKLVIPNQVVSVKTGTTNNLRDNWTVGFTPDFLTITWVGNNDNSPMNPYLVSGITGAAPIWNDIMSYILKNKEANWPNKPSDVSGGEVCPTGLPPETGQDCGWKTQDLYWRQSLPTPSTAKRQNVWIKVDTGLPPAYGEQADNLILEEKTIYSDPLTPLYCGDCQRPVDEQGQTIYEKYQIESNLQPLFWKETEEKDESENSLPQP